MITNRERALARVVVLLGLPIVAWLAVFGLPFPWILVVLLPGLLIYARIVRIAFSHHLFSSGPAPWRACAIWNALVTFAGLPFAFQGDWLVSVYAALFVLLALVAQSEWVGLPPLAELADGQGEERPNSELQRTKAR